jgi:hypothetical protein
MREVCDVRGLGKVILEIAKIFSHACRRFRFTVYVRRANELGQPHT